MQDDYFCHAHNQNGLVGIVFVDKCVFHQLLHCLLLAALCWSCMLHHEVGHVNGCAFSELVCPYALQYTRCHCAYGQKHFVKCISPKYLLERYRKDGPQAPTGQACPVCCASLPSYCTCSQACRAALHFSRSNSLATLNMLQACTISARGGFCRL